MFYGLRCVDLQIEWESLALRLSVALACDADLLPLGGNSLRGMRKSDVLLLGFCCLLPFLITY